MNDEDDTQYMQAQDPGYLDWMEEQRRDWEDNLEKFLCQMEYEEEVRADMASYEEFLAENGFMTDKEHRQEKKYFAEWDEAHSDEGNEDE